MRDDAAGDGAEFAITSRRNCSATPRQVLLVLAATALVNLVIGVAFAVVGLWPVLPFAGLEVAALAVAFYLCGRHATDYERITIAPGRLVLEVSESDCVRTHEFNPSWVRLVASRAAGDLRLALRSHGKEIEIGRHLDADGREQFAATLAARLARF